MKEIVAYVLKCMLTFDKMQNTNPLMYTKFEIDWYDGDLPKAFKNEKEYAHFDAHVALVQYTLRTLFIFDVLTQKTPA